MIEITISKGVKLVLDKNCDICDSLQNDLREKSKSVLVILLLLIPWHSESLKQFRMFNRYPKTYLYEPKILNHRRELDI